MKMEYEVKINDPEFILLLEINDRVKSLMWKVGRDDEKIYHSEIEGLKIDKDSINEISKEINSNRSALADNLTKKIEYIIGTHEKSD